MIAIWDVSLSVGDETIDGEHRLVVNLLNELDVALTVGAPFPVIDKALEALDRGISRHFARGAGPVPASEHLRILGWVGDLRRAWAGGRPDLVDRRALMELGRRWIAHIGRNEFVRRPVRATPPGRVLFRLDVAPAGGGTASFPSLVPGP